MAKPRVFISSTYYDLKHIRNNIESFIESLGYEAVLFESGDIPFLHDTPLDESCYGEIHNSHMLVLVIGGRYGSPTSGSKKLSAKDKEKAYEVYNSVTKKEYETARERDIPIFIFVEKNVFAEYYTYKDNRDNKTINYHHVDSVNIYRLLDDILAQRRNNYVKDFECIDDITNWLRDQWAGLFADYLSRKKAETTLKDLATQISSLGEVSNVLKSYTESIMRKVQPDDFEQIIKGQEKRLRASVIHMFGKEEMINYIKGAGMPRQSSIALYRAFEKSKSLIDFLDKAKLEKDFIDNLMKEHSAAAERDYLTIKERYFSEKNLFIDEDDQLSD